MRGNILAGVGIVLCVSIGLAGPARADLPPPPEYTACDSLQEGNECAAGDIAYGVCVPDTCSQLSYPPDGGTPTTTTYDCLRCDERPRPPEDEDEGCSVGRVGRTVSPWLPLLTIPLLLSMLLRRRGRGRD